MWNALKRSLKAYYGLLEHKLPGYLFNYNAEDLLNYDELRMSNMDRHMGVTRDASVDDSLRQLQFLARYSLIKNHLSDPDTGEQMTLVF
uniref:Cytochrome b-c1 complex subunit 7 n=1 Tax=Caenorhabditis tropicalis TaxID=1561998 RepID=A0A1I7TI53_9PELO